MTHNWKPGDVAHVTWANGESEVLYRHLRGDDYDIEEWRSPKDGCAYPSPDQLRPLVVIDPEDRATFRPALTEFTRSLFGYTATDADCDRFAAALREFAAPTPPKPDEPQGLGAVVEDADDVRWVRDGRGWWLADKSPRESTPHWHVIAAVRVLSEGVTA